MLRVPGRLRRRLGSSPARDCRPARPTRCRTAGAATADLVRPSHGPRARCGKGFALRYASRRRRGWLRGAPRCQGTGRDSGTRQHWKKTETDRRETATRTDQREPSTATVPCPSAASRAHRRATPGPARNTTSCQRWKRTGTSPSHPSASPLNHVVLVKELQLGRRLTLLPPEDSVAALSREFRCLAGIGAAPRYVLLHHSSRRLRKA